MASTERRCGRDARLLAKPGALVANRNVACGECEHERFARYPAVLATKNFCVVRLFAFGAACRSQRLCCFAAGFRRIELPAPVAPDAAPAATTHELSAFDAGSATQDEGPRRRRESAERVCASDRQAGLRCEAAARQARNSADGELSREAAGTRQRDRRFARTGWRQSIERAFEVSIAGDVSGKAENARRCFGGAAMNSRQSYSRRRFFCEAVLTVAACTFAPTAPSAFAAAPEPAPAPAQQQVSRDFQKTMSHGGGGSFSIENKFGEVHVHGEPSRDVKIS